ncbi:MAG: helix-turn-helix domain-containing protein [Pseudomonas sp.]
MHIGQVIYALRREKGLTQEALALEVETATSNLSRIEQGKSSPSLALLERLAGALGSSMTAIYSLVEGVALRSPGACRSAGSEEHSADFTRDAVQLRQSFRELTPENQRLALEFVRMLHRLQQEAAAS